MGDSSYKIFLMIQLGISKEVIEKDMEYDLMWSEGLKLWEEYNNSKFNNSDIDENQCMLNFLDGKLNQTFTIFVDAKEINTYTYHVTSKNSVEAIKKLRRHLEQHRRTTIFNELGINGINKERITLSIENITLEN